MKEDEYNWIENVFESMKGAQRAKPGSHLLAKIENQIDAPGAKVIPVKQWSYAAAVAVSVLLVNVFAMRQFTQYNELNTSEMVVTDDSGQSLISNYMIYE